MTEPFDVAGYEDLSNLYVGVSDWGSDWNTRQSLIGAATSMQALCTEVRRLQGGIQAVRDECATVHAKWTPTNVYNKEKVLVEEAAHNIIDALDTALTYKTEED